MFDSVNLALVKDNISFAGNNAVFREDNTIPELQSRGVTALCKILHDRQFAYLADEVGMGKTYQAIGVIAMLLSEKKNARILVVTPNEAVQRNWINEFHNFSKNNLKNGQAIHAEAMHPIDMIKAYVSDKKVATVSVIRLTSFSTIADRVGKEGNNNYKHSDPTPAAGLFAGLEAIAQHKLKKGGRSFSLREAGMICGAVLKKVTPKFDLVIVDEAQNIRNGNNATTFFNYWMGLCRFKPDTTTEGGRILDAILQNSRNYRNRKYLLLSATPAHRGVESLRSQLLYFERSRNIPEIISHEYLEEFMIRRLRTYSGDSKYAVRNITADDVAKDLKTEQRMFLALIQSKLAQVRASNNANFKIGFLETFESYDVTQENVIDDEETGEKGKEFENGGSAEKEEKGAALDKKMLQQIAKSYGEAFEGEKCPPHPKLNFMEKEAEKLIEVNTCSGSHVVPDKAIVFVRRLASVDELVNHRLNRLYEDRIITSWAKRLEIQTQNPSLRDIQNAFQNLYSKDAEKDDIEEVEEKDSIDQEEQEARSQLLRWLAVKKSDKGNTYGAVSLFKKSMMRNKTNSFFFDENYFRTVNSEITESQYRKLVDTVVDEEFVFEVSAYIAVDYAHYIQGQGKKIKLNYSNLMGLITYLALDKQGHPLAARLKTFFEIKDKTTPTVYIKTHQVKDILLRTSLWNCVNSEIVREILFAEDIFLEEKFRRREALKSWTEKFLKSSEAILEFLYAYTYDKSNRKGKGTAKLCETVWNALYSEQCSYGNRINQLFDNADLLLNQLLGNEEVTYNYDPAFMNLQQWVMPAVGGNKGNGALIKRFNTPFYPDIIVCTDVLKEGINLHMFCNRVYHYGLAWTPGDLEQRIGRVDRFFSKTHRERMSGNDTHVEVDYPYMGKSVDEHQLKKVLQFKLSADPLLDSNGNKDINIDLDNTSTIEDLVKYVPDNGVQTNFPYSGEKYWKESHLTDKSMEATDMDCTNDEILRQLKHGRSEEEACT